MLSRDGNRLLYWDETKQSHYLQIVVGQTRTNLYDGTYDYYWEGPKRP